eukprot:362336_1
MPLSEYFFDQSQVQSAAQSLDVLLQNINNYTLPNITATSTEVNHVLSNVNDQIIPLLINIAQDINVVTKQLIISLHAMQRLFDAVIIAIYICTALCVIITMAYLYTKCCQRTNGNNKIKQL